MTPETFIPMTPATRIPFPCWLWNDNTNEWRERTKRALKSEGYLDMGYTHYCTSATEPTGRPGAEIKHESLDAIDEYFRTVTPEQLQADLKASGFELYNKISPRVGDPDSSVPTASGATNFGGDVQMTPAKDEPYKNTLTPPLIPSNPASGATGEEADLAAHDEWMDNEGDECNTTTGIWFAALAYARKSNPAHPTASGATGEGFMQLLSGVVEAERMVVAGLSSEMPCRKMHENRHRAFREALSMAKSYFASAPDSRPVVAQEGVRDTERLDWLEKNSAGLNDADSPPGPHVWVNLLGELKHFNGKSYRAAIDAAMSSQPEGRG